MRAVVQRVARARVTVQEREVGVSGTGLLVLVGFGRSDGAEVVDWLAEKLVGLRVFADEDGQMNLSVRDVGGELLIVSQFTLYGDVRRGRRPSFVEAATPDVAQPLYDRLVEAVRDRGVAVATGEFGAMMAVELVNDGPVTILLER